MCEHGDTVLVRVPVDARDSWTHELRWTFKAVDRCIAPIVQALNEGGVLTRTSCCGHGKENPEILLADGRVVIVLPGEERLDGGGTVDA